MPVFFLFSHVFLIKIGYARKKEVKDMTYSFTCPLQGCNQTMTTDATDEEEAVQNLTQQAEQHLRESHPDIQKTHEEVMQDIKEHMVQAQ